MIRYDLQCEKFHAFDGWFRDSTAFDAQAAAGLVTCPLCGSAQVEKQLMTPGVPVKANRRSKADGPPQRLTAGPVDAKMRELIEAIRQLKAHVEANADYVGERFADEARRIHYKETEARGIYGESTLEEAKALLEEGIDIHPLPKLPEESN
jgi:hypothetical protein